MTFSDDADRFIPELCVVVDADTNEPRIVTVDMVKQESANLHGMTPGQKFRVGIYRLVGTPQFKKEGHIQ